MQGLSLSFSRSEKGFEIKPSKLNCAPIGSQGMCIHLYIYIRTFKNLIQITGSKTSKLLIILSSAGGERENTRGGCHEVFHGPFQKESILNTDPAFNK